MNKEDKILQRKQLAVNTSLILLHNLVKSEHNVKYYRDPKVNALKWLDVYKRSPDTQRQMSALLILSYTIKSDSEAHLIEDTQGIIDVLVKKLEEQVNGQTNEFSIYELVEGLGKLAVNADNRGKIIEKALENLQTVLLVGNEEERKAAQTALENTGYDPKELLQDTVERDQIVDNMKVTDESDKCSTAVEFIQNMLCVLEQSEDYHDDDCSQVISAIYDGACKDLTREERKVVSEQLLENNLAGILIEIAENLLETNKSKSVYEDDCVFTTFIHVLDLIVFYCDASPLFCDYIASAGAVQFLFGICEGYYSERKNRLEVLLEMHESQFGMQQSGQDHSSQGENDWKEGKSGTGESMSTSQPLDKIDQEQPPMDDTVYCFQLAKSSEATQLVNEGRTVQNLDGSTLRPIVVCTNKPLQTGVMVQIQVDHIMDKSFFTHSELGVSVHSTIPEGTINIGDGLLGSGSGFWMLRGDDIMKDFNSIGGGYKLDLNMVKSGDKIGIARFPNSTIHYFLNGEDMGPAFYDVPEDIYMVLCVSGSWQQVTLLSENKRIKNASEESEKTSSLHEEVKIPTLGGGELGATKIKFPYNVDAIDKDTNPDYHKTVEKSASSAKDFKTGVLDVYQTQKRNAEKLKTIGEKFNQKGYLDELDLEFYISSIENIMTIQIDPISNVPCEILNKTLSLLTLLVVNFLRPDLDRGVLNIRQENRELTGRFADIFERVVKPCFNNLQSLSDFIWAGSTSEGFAFIDEHPGGKYINDEMDLMVPIATVSEVDDAQPGSKALGNVVSELEAVSNNMAKETVLQWHPHTHPGYVRIQVSQVGISFLTKKFLTDVCIETTKDGEQIFQLSRSKIIKSQEDYVYERFPKVKKELAEKCKEKPFVGHLELQQEGPAQTLCVQFPFNQESSGMESMYEQMVDVTLALKCKEWPSIGMPWITRQRNWPDEKLVKRIIEEGCHIVPKAYPGQDGDLELDWRLSFSKAERTLALSINEHQRSCFLLLKALWRKFFKTPRVVSSYHLKTVFLWRCEKVTQELWSAATIGQRFLELLDDLIAFLQKNEVPNFFIPENNMLSHIPDGDIQEVLAKVWDIRRNILMYINKYNNSFGNMLHVSMTPQKK